MVSNKNDDNTILNLKPAEIITPFIVIADFFDVDSLPGHLERLQTWRKCILEDQYFKGDKGSPSELLNFYKLNVCLLEAAYLLKSKTDPLINENADTYFVFRQIYQDYNLSAYQVILYQWLEFGLSASAANEFIGTIDLIRVYENLQKLYNAAWEIHRQSASVSSLQIKDLIEQGEEHSLDSRGVNLYNLNAALESNQQETISGLVAKIKYKVNSVQAVIHLGTAPNDKIYLLVLTANGEQRLAQSLAGMIEDSCRETANVVALVHHASALFTGLKRGNLFFNTALSRNAVYLSGELLLPVTMPLSAIQHNTTSSQWQHWHRLGLDFYNGAKYHLQQGADNAALFCLHQCAECILVALVRAVLNYDINNHNLSRLLTITEMFTADLVMVFKLNEPGNLMLFNELKHAYVNVRYKDSYKAERSNVRALLGTVKQLLNVAERVYEQHMLVSSL
ncbi:HEPN domain-containing protein [Mucilaginibacter gilvus]|uniref:HEPN domain-containing protein n=1 Tax=Mucilaginibacter gilvus TaxID=2305909 RepID=A0A444MS04_9SPHI|nr:HEPN domain-containing protein [Mucilaginibacter gilvus]RWY55395.1 HEPN domain-containing protein [Mucilaginibacter gilvus]